MSTPTTSIWLVERRQWCHQCINSARVVGVYSSREKADHARAAFEREAVFLGDELATSSYSTGYTFSVIPRHLDITVLEGDEAGIWREVDGGREEMVREPA